MSPHRAVVLTATALLALTACRPVTQPLPTFVPHVSRTTPTIMEDDPRWNCLTMGNHVCGPDWRHVTAEEADSLAEGSDLPFTYRWEDCLTVDMSVVVCPDGQVVTS
jgi:hypothetical protein